MLPPWTYRGEWFQPLPNVIHANSWFGFVYIITNHNNDRVYFGKRQFETYKKETQNWWSYWGSSKPLQKDLDLFRYQNFSREVLTIWNTDKELRYEEDRIMFEHDVLKAKLPNGEYKYYNQCIGGKWYRKNLEPKVEFKKPVGVVIPNW